MSGILVLDWAVMAVSLFNIIVLLWLGLTVLLNAERRTWGVWLTGMGMLIGAVFFVSHSIILGHGLDQVGPEIELWWRVGWIPAVTLPFIWYVVMLWYSGYWDNWQGSLRRRQRPWLIFTSVLFLVVVGLLVIANPFPTYSQVIRLEMSATPVVWDIPAAMILYGLYIVLCIWLSLDALRHPEPSTRVMGDLARRRARPWLVGASCGLLAVSVLVAWVVLWIVSTAQQHTLAEIYTRMLYTLICFDLGISSLIALSVVLLGRAIAAYEVFTGKTLPRRRLVQQWRRAVILAAGYGLVVGWSLILQLPYVYGLMLTTILMTLFYALLSWRTFAERERTIEHLRPFVSSSRLYEHLLAPSPSPALELDVKALFYALCNDVLGATLAYLVPLGPLTPLVGSALTFPHHDLTLPPALVGISTKLDSSQVTCVSLDPAEYGGVAWAVPLRSEQGLIGVLLLGAKKNAGLYSQEEIEIAQASCERLMDTLASIEVAQRLLTLQRQRLTESRDYDELSRVAFDQRARRLLHDEVLPLLHTVMLTLSGLPSVASNTADAPLHLLADAHRQVSNLLREMPVIATPKIDQLGLWGALQETVAGELNGAFDEVVWQADGTAERMAQSLASMPAQVLFYAAREAMRNAAQYGRGQSGERPLHLCVGMIWCEPAEGSDQGKLEILIKDDGVGMAENMLSGGTGQGLALHSTMMAVIGGTLSIESFSGMHTQVLLTLPAAQAS